MEGTNVLEAKIELTDEKPINAKQYKFPHNLRTELNRQVESMLKKGVIEESQSPFNSSVWIVCKKNGQLGSAKVENCD